MSYDINQQPHHVPEEAIERQADVILTKDQDPLLLEEAKAIIDRYENLDRLAILLQEREESKKAAEAVISTNPLYSETFSAEEFLTIALGFAVAKTYDLPYKVISYDHELALNDLQSGRFRSALREQIRLKQEQDLEELAEQGKIHLFEYISGEPDHTVQ